MSVFVSYARAIGVTVCLVICLIYILSNALQVYSNIWLSGKYLKIPSFCNQLIYYI